MNSRIEMFIDIKGYNDEKAFTVVILNFKDFASLWFECTEYNIKRVNKPRVKSWAKLKRYLDKEFLPKICKQDPSQVLVKEETNEQTIFDKCTSFDSKEILVEANEGDLLEFEANNDEDFLIEDEEKAVLKDFTS